MSTSCSPRIAAPRRRRCAPGDRGACVAACCWDWAHTDRGHGESRRKAGFGPPRGGPTTTPPTIVDLGCGSGDALAALTSRGVTGIGIDPLDGRDRTRGAALSRSNLGGRQRRSPPAVAGRQYRHRQLAARPAKSSKPRACSSRQATCSWPSRPSTTWSNCVKWSRTARRTRSSRRRADRARADVRVDRSIGRPRHNDSIEERCSTCCAEPIAACVGAMPNGSRR